MVDLISQSDVVARPGDKPKGSALGVYLRLVGYAWNYKGRLLLSLVFALVIAASLSTALVGIGAVVSVTFYDSAEAEAGPDPVEGFAEKAASAEAWLAAHLFWTPQHYDARLRDLAVAMRANKMQALSIACAIVVLFVLVGGVARFLQEYFAGIIGAHISTDLGMAMYENLVRQPLGFFEARSSGDILARFANDIFMVNRGLAGVFVKLMREPLKAAFFLIIALSKDPWLTLVGLCVLPPLAYALARFGKKVRHSVRRSLQKIASMTSVINETVSGMIIVKGFNMEGYETGRVRREVGKLRRFLKKMVKADALTGPTTEVILVLGVVAFVLLSGRRVMAQQLDAADLLLLYGALAMMLDPVRKLSSVNNMIQTSVASAERVFEFVDMGSDITEAEDAAKIDPLQDVLRFEGVHFAYDGKTEVLRGVNLTVKKGEMVALVGFSGAGKSTLVKLIPRFYDVTAGAVTIDGVDVRQATFHSLRDQISIVTQETILFAESVRDNIAYGHGQYTDERVREAAQAAHADEFIGKLAEGYDTVIGESGSTLSGGQRQRLAIARAIIKDPAILILDEATSSLDSESERHIQEALDAFVTGRTALVIAHRLSTIQRADRIVVLDEGRVAEEGTHEELLARGGIYQRLYETQFGTQEPA